MFNGEIFCFKIIELIFPLNIEKKILPQNIPINITAHNNLFVKRLSSLLVRLILCFIKIILSF